ncbi:hypothetical protein GCE9029_01435 [Grimontia celer]|uniref:Tetratricopeptide repeat protein n=1 Tax=Grimontia celer TaxID=1796497 RepID=A0A128EYX8_9GAMM|nr:hypothetical protein [Grimontia celer]CZF79394.1 hypothetical protein GCE9029_01435 [Grimontia celer]
MTKESKWERNQIYAECNRGIKLALEGKFEKAEQTYRTIISALETNQQACPPDVYQQLACALSEQNKNEEALTFHQLAFQKMQEASSNEPTLRVGRFFLTEQLNKMKRYEETLTYLEGISKEPLLLCIEAMARRELGQTEAANVIAKEALALCESEQQIQGISARLHKAGFQV